MKLSLQISLSSLLLVSALTTAHVVAVDSTPSAGDSASPDEITNNLKERLIETIGGVSQVDTAPVLTGYVGRVRDIVQDTIVIEDKSGKKNILISDDTAIVRSPGNAGIKLTNVRIDDGIIAMGSPANDNDEINGKRIIVSDSPFNSPSKTSGIATITKMNKNSYSLSAIGSSSPVLIEVNSKTDFKNSDETLEQDDFTVGDTVVYSADVDSKDPTDLTATVLMQVKTQEPLPSPLPSPSVTGKVSPEPSPKVSPKASPKEY